MGSISYIVEMGFHVNEEQCFLEEGHQETGRYPKVIVLVLVHISLLGEHKR